MWPARSPCAPVHGKLSTPASEASALRGIVGWEGLIPAPHTADAPICIPMPIAAWATQVCAGAGSIDVHHIHTTLWLLGLAFCGRAGDSHQKASQESEALQGHSRELEDSRVCPSRIRAADIGSGFRTVTVQHGWGSNVTFPG